MLKITLVRSSIGAEPRNKRTVKALGLRKTGRTVYREDTPSIRGMVNNVQHLLRVETVDSAPGVLKKVKKDVVTHHAPAKVVEKPAAKPASKKVEGKKPAAKKPAAAKKAAPKKPAEKKPAAKKPQTDRKNFAEVGKKKPAKKKES
jgi:large subunit ribosomal protein L30